MSEQVTIEWPQKDVDALFRSMDMAQRYLNYDAGHALAAAAKSLLGALRTSTKRAPKWRKVTEATWIDEEALGRFRRGHLAKRNLLAWNVDGFFGRPRRHMIKTVFSKDKETVKRNHARIGNQGLAQMVWVQAAKSLSSGLAGLVSAASDHMVRTARRMASTDKNFKGGDQFWEMHNTLDYVMDALQGGANDVSTAMERAARGMEHSIERQLVKRMGLGSLAR